MTMSYNPGADAMSRAQGFMGQSPYRQNTGATADNGSRTTSKTVPTRKRRGQVSKGPGRPSALPGQGNETARQNYLAAGQGALNNPWTQMMVEQQGLTPGMPGQGVNPTMNWPGQGGFQVGQGGLPGMPPGTGGMPGIGNTPPPATIQPYFPNGMDMNSMVSFARTPAGQQVIASIVQRINDSLVSGQTM